MKVPLGANGLREKTDRQRIYRLEQRINKQATQIAKLEARVEGLLTDMRNLYRDDYV